VGDKDGWSDDYAIIDLSMPENDTRQIKKIIDPKKHNIDIRKMLLEV